MVTKHAGAEKHSLKVECIVEGVEADQFLEAIEDPWVDNYDLVSELDTCGTDVVKGPDYVNSDLRLHTNLKLFHQDLNNSLIYELLQLPVVTKTEVYYNFGEFYFQI